MRTRRAGAVALLSALGCAAVDLPDAPVIAPQEHARWLAPLESGLRVLVLEDHSAPVVTAVAVVGVGGTSDPPGREGLAHLVEHLAFRSRPGGGAPLWDELSRMGASFNAYTTSDLTVFHASVHKDQLPRLMQLSAWRLARTLEGVTPEVFAAEKGVVRNERRQRDETTLGTASFERLLQALFPPGHPLARPLGGSDASLEAISWADVVALVRRHYTADNFTLVIAGDVDPAQVSREIGMWPAEILFAPPGAEVSPREPRPSLAARPSPPLPAPHRRDLQRHRGPVSQPELLIGWSLPPGYRGGGALLRLTATRLDQALALALDPIRDREIERLDSQSVELADASVILVHARLRPGCDPEWARARLLDLVGQAWIGEPSNGESAAGRWGAITSLLLSSVEPLPRALALAEHLAATGQATYYRDHFRELSAISPADVRALGERFVNRDRAVALLVEPESDQIPSVASGARIEQTAAHVQADPGRALVAADTGADRIRYTVPSPGLGLLPHFQLGNGLEVFVIPRPAAPIAQIELALRGGDASTRPTGLARLAAGLHPPSCRIHGSLHPVGGRILGLHGLTESETFVRVFSGNLANGLAVLSDSVRCREPDSEAVLHLRDRLQEESARWQRVRRRPEIVAGQKLWSALYPGHPFGEAGFSDPLALAHLGAGQARAFVDGHFRPDNGVLIVHGQVQATEVRTLAERYFGKWSAASGPALSMAPPPVPAGPTRRALHIVDRPGATQASLSLGCRLADARPAWRPAYDVLEKVAGKLAWKLRERWGATYGVHASVGLMSGDAAHLQLTGTVENAAAGPAVVRLLAAVREIATGAVDPELFSAIRWEVGRAFSIRFASAAVQANAIRNAFLHRWPLSVWDDYPRNLAATGPDVLRTLMVGCLGREVLAIVGDARVLKPQLQDTGFELEISQGGEVDVNVRRGGASHVDHRSVPGKTEHRPAAERRAAGR